MFIVLGVFALFGIGILAFLGVRAALQEEKKRKAKAQVAETRRDAGVPMFPARRGETDT
jgi:hypothetical protein